MGFKDTNDFVNLGICKHDFKFTCRGYSRFTLRDGRTRDLNVISLKTLNSTTQGPKIQRVNIHLKIIGVTMSNWFLLPLGNMQQRARQEVREHKYLSDGLEQVKEGSN